MSELIFNENIKRKIDEADFLNKKIKTDAIAPGMDIDSVFSERLQTGRYVPRGTNMVVWIEDNQITNF